MYREKYVHYLVTVIKRLEDIRQRQRAVNQRLYPSLEALPQVVMEREALQVSRQLEMGFIRRYTVFFLLFPSTNLSLSRAALVV
jgi:hypothetical protein